MHEDGFKSVDYEGRVDSFLESTSKNAEVVRDTIERAISDNLQSLPAGTVILAHVATPVHLRAYKAYYGFLPVEGEAYKLHGATHVLMAVTKERLLQKLSMRIFTRLINDTFKNKPE